MRYSHLLELPVFQPKHLLRDILEGLWNIPIGPRKIDSRRYYLEAWDHFKRIQTIPQRINA